MLSDLDREERLLLLRFVCAFAWTDLEIKEGERQFVARLAGKLELEPEDRKEVEQWLHVAPAPSDVDPKQIPTKHRRVFFEAVRAVLYADGDADDVEKAHLEELRTALGL